VVKEMGISEVFIAIPRPPEDLIIQIRGYCEENGLLCTTVNSLAPTNEPSARTNE